MTKPSSQPQQSIAIEKMSVSWLCLWLFLYASQKHEEFFRNVVLQETESRDFGFVGDLYRSALLDIRLCRLLCRIGYIDKITFHVAGLSATKLRSTGHHEVAERLLRCIVAHDAKLCNKDQTSLLLLERHAGACLYIKGRVHEGIRTFLRTSCKHWKKQNNASWFNSLKWAGFGLMELGHLDAALYFNLKLVAKILDPSIKASSKFKFHAASDATFIISSVLIRKGKFNTAEPLAMLVWKDRAKRLGPDHVETLHSQMNLGAIAASQGDTSKARKIYSEIHQRAKRGAGPQHSLTSASRDRLLGLSRPCQAHQPSPRLGDRTSPWLYVFAFMIYVFIYIPLATSLLSYCVGN